MVIKVIAKGREGLSELKILELLSVEPLKSDPANPTVPIVEFLHYHDWHFVVMPFCDGSDVKPFLNAMECLEFAEQVLSVSLSTHTTYISWLLNYLSGSHRLCLFCTIIELRILCVPLLLTSIPTVHCLFIVHQDIAYENILINHHGKIPSDVVWTSRYELPTKIIPPPEFRSTFPIRYFLIDFGVAHEQEI